MSDENQSSDSGSPPSKRTSLSKFMPKRRGSLRSRTLLSEQALASTSQDSSSEQPTEIRAFAAISSSIPPHSDQPVSFRQKGILSEDSSTPENAEENTESEEGGDSVSLGEEEQKEEQEGVEKRDEEKYEKEDGERETDKKGEQKEEEIEETKVKQETEEKQKLSKEAKIKNEKLEMVELTEIVATQSDSKIKPVSSYKVVSKEEKEEDSDLTDEPKSTDSDDNRHLETESSTSEELPTKRLKIEKKEKSLEQKKSSDLNHVPETCEDLPKLPTSVEVRGPPNVTITSEFSKKAALSVSIHTVPPTGTTASDLNSKALSVTVTKPTTSVARSQLETLFKASEVDIVPPNRTIGPDFARCKSLSDKVKTLASASAAARSTPLEENIVPPNRTIGPGFDTTFSVLVPKNVSDAPSGPPRCIFIMGDNVVPPNRTIGPRTNLGVTVPTKASTTRIGTVTADIVPPNRTIGPGFDNGATPKPILDFAALDEVPPNRTVGIEVSSSNSSSSSDKEVPSSRPVKVNQSQIKDVAVTSSVVVSDAECVHSTSSSPSEGEASSTKSVHSSTIDPYAVPFLKTRGRSRVSPTYISVKDQIVPPNRTVGPEHGFTGKRPKVYKSKESTALSVEVPVVTTKASIEAQLVESPSQVASSSLTKTGEEAPTSSTESGSKVTESDKKTVVESEFLLSSSSTSSGEGILVKSTVASSVISPFVGKESELPQDSPPIECEFALSSSSTATSGEAILVDFSPTRSSIPVHAIKSQFVSTSSTSSGEGLLVKATVAPQVISHLVSTKLKLEDSPPIECEFALSSSSTTSGEVMLIESPVTSSGLPEIAINTQSEGAQELPPLKCELSSTSTSSGDEPPPKRRVSFAGIIPKMTESAEVTALSVTSLPTPAQELSSVEAESKVKVLESMVESGLKKSSGVETSPISPAPDDDSGDCSNSNVDNK